MAAFKTVVAVRLLYIKERYVSQGNSSADAFYLSKVLKTDCSYQVYPCSGDPQRRFLCLHGSKPDVTWFGGGGGGVDHGAF